MEKKSDKSKDSEALKCIYGLIDELGREKPDVKILKSLCLGAGITYEVDLIQLMSKVLVRASYSSISVVKSGHKTKKIQKMIISEA